MIKNLIKLLQKIRQGKPSLRNIPSKSREEKIKSYWNFLISKKKMRGRNKVDWSGLRLMHEHFDYVVTGNGSYPYLKYFWDKYLKGKKPIIASLGCGNGHLERSLVSMNCHFSKIDGFEINPSLVEFANREAARNNIAEVKYYEANLNALKLPEKYDLIIFFHSLHHVENLESCLDVVFHSLADDGLVLIVDYLGPNRFQWTDVQLAYAQELLDILPERLKVYISAPSGFVIKKTIDKPTIEEVSGGDPSEAIRSSDIIGALRPNFHIIEYKPLGGTILNLLFQKIAGNFNERDAVETSLIKSFQKFEETLIKNSVIPSDFAFIVLSKNPIANE